MHASTTSEPVTPEAPTTVDREPAASGETASLPADDESATVGGPFNQAVLDLVERCVSELATTRATSES